MKIRRGIAVYVQIIQIEEFVTRAADNFFTKCE